jgi:hypothetical protein
LAQQLDGLAAVGRLLAAHAHALKELAQVLPNEPGIVYD